MEEDFITIFFSFYIKECEFKSVSTDFRVPTVGTVSTKIPFEFYFEYTNLLLNCKASNVDNMLKRFNFITVIKL